MKYEWEFKTGCDFTDANFEVAYKYAGENDGDAIHYLLIGLDEVVYWTMPNEVKVKIAADYTEWKRKKYGSKTITSLNTACSYIHANKLCDNDCPKCPIASAIENLDPEGGQL